MIIWLSSYPKNGNTWLRSLISAYYYTKDGFFLGDKQLRNIQQFPTKKFLEDFDYNLEKPGDTVQHWVEAQKKINLDNKIKFLKTHFLNCKVDKYNFTDQNNTLGTIHIVRDPRNIISSLKNHYLLNDYNEASEFLFNEEKWIVEKENKQLIHAPILLSSWATHYNMWKQSKKNYLLIKYENLLTDPVNEFLKITDFLGSIVKFKFEEKEILELIENCKFEKFSNQEDNHGFIDNSSTNKSLRKKFFKLGPNNNWEKLLDSQIRVKIEKTFENEMKELQYL